MAPALRHPHRPMLDEYKDVLKQFTHQVACQNRCELNATKTCSCLRHIIHVDALKQWWDEKAPGRPSQTRLERLLEEMPEPDHRTFPWTSTTIQKLFKGDQSCLRVFSLLLSLDRADLIEIFYESDMTDKRLDIVRDNSNRRLHKSLRSIKPHEVDAIVQEFSKERWAYCPLTLSLGMERHLEETKVIPPFCHKIPLSNKGATASIYWVAVQKDLIIDDGLKRAIQDSIYEDEIYGECYQMVLKTFCGDKESFFNLEKAAFEGLPYNHEVPIVRYLGCYTHSYGDGSAFGNTYNLLLECGERDLYQAWADETNVPPVRAEEIIRFWDSHFGVAQAIRHLHKFTLPRRGSNGPVIYNGWHADIKPDNILVFRGRLKLADFGLSRFARVVRRPGGGLPTELVDGFTISYGAPEISKLNSDGTVSGVTQSIDTWSFGCVLSVAATWLVLGFQGVRVFEQLRLQASHDGTDRFHDGSAVLPHIRRWHNFLRGHLRPSDTATSLVLDLIENNMLQAEPPNRMGLEELCVRLQDIHSRAIANLDALGEHSRTTDPSVLGALLAIEKKAQAEKEIRRNSTTAPALDINLLNPVQRATMQVDRGDLFKSKPLGQTPFRREILEKELQVSTVGQDNQERHAGRACNGTITDSPTSSSPLEDAFASPPSNQRKQKRRNPDYLHVEFSRDSTVRDETTSSPPPIMAGRDREDEPLQRRGGPSGQSLAKPNEHDHPASPQRITDSSGRNLEDYSDSSPVIYPNKLSLDWQDNAGHTHVNDPYWQATSPLHAKESSRITASRPARHSSYRTHEIEQQRRYSGLPGLAIPTTPPSRNRDRSEALQNHVVTTHGILGPEPLPDSVYSLPYDICKVRKELELQNPKSTFARVKSIMGREERKRDQGLADIYGTGREIIFIVDNGATMLEHWPIVVFVAETMVKKAAGLDRNGVDLRFTVDGSIHNKSCLKTDGGRKEFRTALNAAEPENSANREFQTDMHHTLNDIVKQWKNNGKPDTTLLILTDGRWESTMESLVDNTILDIAGELSGYSGPRSFSIQFIRFGEECAYKLAKLDNDLCRGRRLRDIVDHCSWRSTVEKIFKGSILGTHDEDDPAEIPITFEYPALVALFRSFNNDIQHDRSRPSSMLYPPLTPTKNLMPRSPSRGPSTAPLNRASSWQTHSRTPSSQ